MTLVMFIPIFDQECDICDSTPCVGIKDPEAQGIRSTGACGIHFFRDRAMQDWEDWNTSMESTE